MYFHSVVVLPHSSKKTLPLLSNPPHQTKKNTTFLPNNSWGNTAGHTLFNRRIRLPPRRPSQSRQRAGVNPGKGKSARGGGRTHR